MFDHAKPFAALMFIVATLSGCGMTGMPGKSFRGDLPEATESQIALQSRLRRDVEKLAGDIGDRNVLAYGEYTEAANYIQREFESFGYTVERQTYQAEGRDCWNIEVEIRGSSKPDEIVIIGGHYDSVFGCPGANDNATAVAAVLELSRNFARKTPVRTLRFVAFANEEPPFFQTDLMGSMVYAKRCRDRNENVVAMIALDGLGYYSDEKGSQNYPFPFSMLYPSTANFIGFVANNASHKLLRNAIRSFRENAQFPSEGVLMPEFIQGAGWSDHWSFWQYDYPGIMVTDTLPFRYHHYHTAEDTIDKINFDRFARVVEGLRQVIAELVQ